MAINDALIRSVVEGNRDAEHTLIGELAPRIEAIARNHPELRRRGLSSLEDDVAEVRMAALERLLRDGHKNLSRYLHQRSADASARPADFDSWLYGAVDFSVRDHLRKRFGRAPKTAPDSPKRPLPSRRDLGTLAGRFDDEQLDRSFIRTLGATQRLTATAIVDYMTAQFAHQEVEAMRMFYFEDRSFAEISQRLGLQGEREAEKLIRRLNARLRYRFNEE